MSKPLRKLKRRNNILYRLPIIVSKKDLEVEQLYINFYNEAYWKNYKTRE